MFFSTLQESANNEKPESGESIQLPVPPASLNSAQKKEYLELHRKLALHAKKKGLGTAASCSKSSLQAQGKPRDKPPTPPSKSRLAVKDKPLPKSGVQSLLRKPLSVQVTTTGSKTRSNSEPSITVMSKQRKTDTVDKLEKSRKPTGPVTVESVGARVSESKDNQDELSSAAMEPESEEVTNKTQQQAHQLMVKTTFARQKREGNMQQKQRIVLQHRITVEECQKELTTLTHQLTETVSEIEELELKTENLKKALQVGTHESCIVHVLVGEILTFYMTIVLSHSPS